MRLRDYPVIRTVTSASPDDTVFDGFMLAGPFVILAFVIGGRSTLTTALATAYVLGFFGYVAFKGLVGSLGR